MSPTDDAAPKTVAVAGGTGFIGRCVVQLLRERGDSVIVLARRPQRLPATDGVVVRAADVGAEPPDLAGCDAVINLVGIKAPRGTNDFERAHVRAVDNLAAGMEAAGIRRLVHVSVVALPSTLGPSATTKAEGEDAARRANLDTTVIRPALVVGPGDDAITNLVRFVRLAPLFPISAGPLGKLAPVDVRDVAAAIVAAVHRPDAIGKTIDVTGPEALDLRALVGRVARALALPTLVLPVPGALQRIAATVLERLPGSPLVTRSQLAMLDHGLQGDATAAAEHLGVTPRPVDETSIAAFAESVTDLAPSLRIAPTAAHRHWLAERLPAARSLLWFVPVAVTAMLLAPRVLPNVWIRMAGLEVALGTVVLAAMPRLKMTGVMGASVRNVALGLAAAAGLYVACGLGFAALGRVAPSLAAQAATLYAWPATLALAAQIPLLVLTVAGEDIVFRAAIGIPAAARWGPGPGVVVAALVFAVAHATSGPPILWLAALVCGAVWTALLIRTRSWVATFVCHLAFDVMAIYLLPYR